MSLMNFVLGLCFVIVGGYFIYNTYKKPSPMISTDLKGYFGGLGALYYGVMTLLGKVDLIQIFKDIFNIK